MGVRTARGAVALFKPLYYLPYLDGIAKRYNKILWINHKKTGSDMCQSR
jgi:hypothetical protein